MHKQKIRKILITNIVSLNMGDAAILQGTIALLTEKYGEDIKVVVFDRKAEVAQKYYPWATFKQSFFDESQSSFLSRILTKYGYSHWALRFRYWRLRLAMRLIKKNAPGFFADIFVNESDKDRIQDYLSADLIFSTGGTYLIENYSLTTCIYDYMLSLVAGSKKLGFFTQTLGPFKSTKNINSFRYIFQNAILVLLRDVRSFDHIKNLGVNNSNMHISPDAAFALANDEHWTDLDGVSNNPNKPPRVAISVRSMRHFHEEKADKYENAIVALVTELVRDNGAEVVFVSTCQGIPEYWTDDSETARGIVAKMGDDTKKNVTVIDSFFQPMELVSFFREFDLVVATRMHASILAICGRIPVIGLAYEFKTIELFKSLGLAEQALDIGTLAESEIAVLSKKLLEDYSKSKKDVIAAAEAARSQVMATLEYLP